VHNLFVVLGNQLFPFAHVKPYRDHSFYMTEDFGLCTYVRHHKQKIALFLGAMRSYRDELRDHGVSVHYRQLDPDDHESYEDRLLAHIKGHNVERVTMWEIEDRPFEKSLRDTLDTAGVEVRVLPSPMFLTERSDFADWLSNNRAHMADFYKWQRKRLGVMVDNDNKPDGGRWSFDDENRDPLPKSVKLPTTAHAGITDHISELIPIINDRFDHHPGELNKASWWLPSTRRSALAWLRSFLDDRFKQFGPYEDALSTRDPFLFHSALSPLMNLGLLTPDEIITRAIEHAEQHNIPLNSLEGFTRQIIGWREFIRGIDRELGDMQDDANFFNHDRALTDAWYDATTGVPPLDDTITKLNRYGWAHHIERLMVASNLMVLCEIHPDEAYRWFMEMFVDSSDWVMGPNVRGMGLFADGGLFSTKPYICGSNYIRKMSDYPKPKPSDHSLFSSESDDVFAEATWCDVMDGLYWRFVDKQRDFFKNQARMAQMVGTLDRMKPERRDRIVTIADRFIETRTRQR
jgi:deoxyribodipyrimidine photolyase-related protein